MGWTNHRANRLVDLANAHNSPYWASAFAQGVEENFGCTAPKVATQIQKKSRGLVFLGTILKSKQGINANK